MSITEGVYVLHADAALVKLINHQQCMSPVREQEVKSSVYDDHPLFV